MEKMKDLNEIKHKLIDWVKTETVKGFNSPEEVEILGEVVDMIKDLASAEESCMEAAYYENVTEAMENYEQDGGEGRMGYDRWRYSSGRFAPKGRGRMGYEPMIMDDPEPYMNGKNMRYGYTAGKKPKEQLDGAIEVMGDVWSNADSELREKMKSSVKDLLYQMEQA